MPWLKYSVTRRSRRSRREIAPLECRGGATVAPAQVADIGVPFCPRRPVAWSSAAWWAPGWPPRPAPRVRVRTLSPTKPSASPAPRLRAMPGNFRRSCHRHRRRHHHPPARPTSSAAARKAAARTAPSTPSAPHPNCKSPTCPPLPHARYLDIATVCDRADTYALGPPYCTYGLRAAASCAPCVPEAQGSLPRRPNVLYVRGSSLGRTVRSAYRGTLGGHGPADRGH